MRWLSTAPTLSCFGPVYQPQYVPPASILSASPLHTSSGSEAYFNTSLLCDLIHSVHQCLLRFPSSSWLVNPVKFVVNPLEDKVYLSCSWIFWSLHLLSTRKLHGWSKHGKLQAVWKKTSSHWSLTYHKIAGGDSCGIVLKLSTVSCIIHWEESLWSAK